VRGFPAQREVAIAEAVREELGDRRGRNQYSEGLDNCPEADARDIAAKRSGFSSGKQYERAKAVTTHGAPEQEQVEIPSEIRTKT
jgi:hypothetical protein